MLDVGVALARRLRDVFPKANAFDVAEAQRLCVALDSADLATGKWAGSTAPPRLLVQKGRSRSCAKRVPGGDNKLG